MRVAVISSFPKIDAIHGAGTVGGASYTKNLLLSLKEEDIQFTVFADQLEDYTKDNEKVSKKIAVQRVWSRNSLSSLHQLYLNLKSTKAETILVSLEAYMFGSLLHLGAFLMYLGILRFFDKKKAVMIMHQVPDVSFFSNANQIKKLLIRIALSVLYSFILLLSEKVIVFEDYFKNLLYNNEKVEVIPHAVETVRKIRKDHARKRLNINPGDYIVLYFGFISEYKGVKKLISVWSPDNKQHLIVAGGPNKQHERKKVYRSFISNIAELASYKDVTLTGFLEEDDIPLYFSAADCVILPYEKFFSSSGPLSLAFAFEKPVILSEALHKYEFSKDFGACMHKHNIMSTDMFARITSKGLSNAINNVKAHEVNFIRFSQSMKEERSWSNISKLYAKVLLSGENYV